jgi:hypothetical protein
LSIPPNRAGFEPFRGAGRTERAHKLSLG